MNRRLRSRTAEIDDLFRIIQQLRESGVGIVYISHRMEELKRITDRITIMRDSCYIETLKTKDATIDQIISLMVGREILQYDPRLPQTKADQETVLRGQKPEARLCN